ncbi:MAG: T9SS type A sorting domain-containing protein [Bacteroidota bacterium]
MRFFYALSIQCSQNGYGHRGVRNLGNSLLAGLLLFFLFISSSGLFGQELSRSVVGSAGTYFSAVNVGNIHFTVGEVAVDRTQNGIVLERGFHHGLFDLLSTSVWTAPEVQLQLDVFPNPTADMVTLSGDWTSRDRLQIRDLLGRSLLDRTLPPERVEMSLRAYPPGTYLLTIVRDGRPLKTLRVIRQ